MKDIVISDKTKAEWQAELDRLDLELKRISDQRSILYRKIELVSLIEREEAGPFKRNFDNLPFAEPQASTSNGSRLDPEMKITEAIRTALQTAAPKTYTRLTLRHHLESHLPKERLGLRYSAYYGTLKRLTDGKQMTEDSSGRITYAGKPGRE